MLELSVIGPGHLPYGSPMVIVKKKDGSGRCCQDIRQINRIKLFDNEPMPQPEAIYVKLKGDNFPNAISQEVFGRSHIASKGKEKTAFVTPDGCFQFRKMPFGRVNSTATINRMMRKLPENMQNSDSFVDNLLSHTQTHASP